MNDYYVYEHVRPDNKSVYYVGKGHGNRAYEKRRNKEHDEIERKYGLEVNIVKSGMTEDEAYKYEKEHIEYLLSIGYGIQIKGLEGTNPDMMLTNKTFGSKGSIGISNPMYGVSPRERMSEEKYEEWAEKTYSRLKNQYGENNPNYGNDTLHNKVKDNKELRIQYYSRPATQNGRSRKIKLFDINHNYIETFDYIGACCEYLKDKLNLNSNINSIRSNITQRTKKGLPYRNHYFEFI